MGFFDSVKKVSGSVIKNVSKSIDKAVANNRAQNEAYQVKRRILLNLSITELKNMAYLLGMSNLEYENYFDDKSMSMKERKIKLDKFGYVDSIANKPYSEIVLKLKHLRKSSLADEMEREVSAIEARLKEEKNSILNEVSPEDLQKNKDLVLSVYLETIVKEIISLSPEKAKNEKNYQTELKGFLKSAIKKEFPKQKVSVEIEYPTKTGKRIDILVQIDNYKIGIETKYELSSSGHFQRAVGQALEYSQFLDALIIVQYETLDNEIGLNNLKKLSNSIMIPFRVIANGCVKI